MKRKKALLETEPDEERRDGKRIYWSLIIIPEIISLIWGLFK
ncbi:MAG: hypothetical protein U0354_07175 [Candidatus Sericytochromatia bacterium]